MSSVKTLLFLFIAVVLTESAKLEDYCKHGDDNIPCKYKCKRSSKCGDTEKFRLLTSEEREEAVRLHNKYRQLIAKGDFNNVSLPAASNMNALSYDKECEFFSGCYIQQCVFEHDNAYTASGEGIGQSLYTMAAPWKITLNKDIITRGINSWFREVHQVSSTEGSQMVDKFQLRFETGHFSQMMWADTKYVGCAMMRNAREAPSFTYDMFCHYLPGGNMPNRPMYKPGGMQCSKNGDYPNLCGSIRPLSEDKYKFPEELGGSTDALHKKHNSLFLLFIFVILSLIMQI